MVVEEIEVETGYRVCGGFGVSMVLSDGGRGFDAQVVSE